MGINILYLSIISYPLYIGHGLRVPYFCKKISSRISVIKNISAIQIAHLPIIKTWVHTGAYNLTIRHGAYAHKLRNKSENNEFQIVFRIVLCIKRCYIYRSFYKYINNVYNGPMLMYVKYFYINSHDRASKKQNVR